jgi:ligand-binding sensor domain-containing protein
MATTINLDTATRVDITCRKGDTFKLEFTFTDDNGDAIDLTSYAWKMDVKETDTSSADIIADSDFTYTGTDQGKLTVDATAATMAAVAGGLYVYDLQSTSAGTVKTWVYGLFKINEDVSE